MVFLNYSWEQQQLLYFFFYITTYVYWEGQKKSIADPLQECVDKEPINQLT